MDVYWTWLIDFHMPTYTHFVTAVFNDDKFWRYLEASRMIQLWVKLFPQKQIEIRNNTIESLWFRNRKIDSGLSLKMFFHFIENIYETKTIFVKIPR